MTDDTETERYVEAYLDGVSFLLPAEQIECDRWMDRAVAGQVRDAIRAGRDAGLTISISSAWRSMAQQQELYSGWKQGLRGFNPADPPGHSKHQLGTAIDLHFASEEQREEFAALAIAHGLTRPAEREPWHFVAAPLPKESST